MKKRILTTTLVCFMLILAISAFADSKDRSVTADSMDGSIISDSMDDSISAGSKKDTDSTETSETESEKTLPERDLGLEEPYATVKTWAEGVKTRDGKLQYSIMSQNLKDEYYPIFDALGWVTGVSSPWVESYEIAETHMPGDDSYRYKVVFTYTDSTKSCFSEIKYVTVRNHNNIWLVSSIEEAGMNPSLGGISLGDSSQSVISILGSNCTKTDEPDSAGYIGEDMTVWRYESGISVTIGKTSGKVLKISSVSPDFQTELGVKAGDDLNTVYESYGPLYKEAVSRHGDEVLRGWFHTGEEAVIIFDFDKSDNTLINSSITPESEVEEIIIAYWKHFD